MTWWSCDRSDHAAPGRHAGLLLHGGPLPFSFRRRAWTGSIAVPFCRRAVKARRGDPARDDAASPAPRSEPARILAPCDASAFLPGAVRHPVRVLSYVMAELMPRLPLPR